jgi:D-3-phosphoglycerate dehydrogenase / 2-oxoglutarate reductase
MKIYLGFHQGVRDLRFGEKNLAELRTFGTVVLNEETHAHTNAELIEAAKGCEIVFSDRMTPGGAEFLDNAPDLIAYVRTVTDMRIVDVEAASRNGILVTSNFPTFVPGVTEWVLGQMLALARHFHSYVSCYRAGWIPDLGEGPRGRQLYGQTVGIVGLGRLGRRLAEILNFLGMRVLGHDPYLDPWPADVERTDFNDLMAQSDFVVCLALQTEETVNLMNAEAFALMKPTAFFVDASRGAITDDAALEDVLVRNAIAGAALDVGKGPGDVPSLRLGRLPNVLATPHVAPSMDANHMQGEQSLGYLRDILDGKTPAGAHNAEHATRLSRLAKGAP